MKVWPIRTRFSWGSVTPSERPEEPVGRVDDPQLGRRVRAERLGDARPLARAEQAVIDEHADHPRPEGLRQQGRADRRIDPAREPADDPVIRTHLPGDLLDRAIEERVHRPRAGALADAIEEIPEDERPVRCVGDLGVELQSIDRQGPVPDGRDRAGRGRRDGHERLTRCADLVAVAHPDGRGLGHAVEQRVGRVDHPAFRPPELPGGARLDLPPQRLADQLHPVADRQDRDAHFKEARVAVRAPPARRRSKARPRGSRPGGSARGPAPE